MNPKLLYLVRVCGGMAFGFLSARLIAPRLRKLGIWTDIVGISLALTVTGLWIFVLGKLT